MGFQDILILPSKDSDILKDVDSKLITISESKTEGISVEHFINLAQNGCFKEHGYIHEILERSEICLVSAAPEPRNPELEARIQKLKAEQENEEYKKMTKGLQCTQERKISHGNEVKLMTSQFTALINFVLTVIGSFFFAYKAVEYALPEENILAQVMVGIITASVVALADLYFLIRTI